MCLPSKPTHFLHKSVESAVLGEAVLHGILYLNFCEKADVVSIETKRSGGKLSAMAKARISDLDRKISELAREKARLVDKRDSARTSVERGESYRTVHGLKYLCPYCWIIHGQMSPLVYLLSPNNAETYRCDSCQSEFPVNKSARAGADAP